MDFTFRLHEAELEHLEPLHLYSALDDPEPAAPMLCGVTEWQAPGVRALSFGWDWSVTTGAELVGHWSTLRTNAVLVGADGRVLPDAALQRGVERLMQHRRWQLAVAQVLGLPTG